MLAGLSSQSKKGKSPVCQFTHSALKNSNIDIRNLPLKRLPFSAFEASQIFSSAHVALPTELYQLAFLRIEELSRTSYARVSMSLLDILSGDFFTQYVRIGNIAMRSQGRSSVDLVIQLANGTLSIELDAPTYERCGLVGKPIASAGRKHVKSRYRIEHDLRAPSAVRGKKGFDRLLYACKNVLNQQMTWLFADLSPSSGEEQIRSGPIKDFQPHWRPLSAEVTKYERQRTPFVRADEPSQMSTGDMSKDHDYVQELFEWIGMMTVGSPRLRLKDDINQYLCCYDTPTAHLTSSHKSHEGSDNLYAEDVTYLRWHALISSKFLSALFLCLRDVIRANPTPQSSTKRPWFTLAAGAFTGGAVTVCCPGTITESGALDILTWEVPP